MSVDIVCTNSKRMNTTNDKPISPSSSLFSALRVLMISPEYPPINGGVGRYTYNLVHELKRQGVDVYVASDNQGNGDYVGLSPNNIHNSEILLSLVEKIKPNIVHIQYEPGLYGLKMHSHRRSKIHTTIDLFYAKSRVPIVTTFHSGYTFRQWMRIPEIKINKKESMLVSGRNVDDKKHRFLSRIRDTLDNINIYWKYLSNYEAFQNQNKEILLRSDKGIVFSDYMKSIIGVKSSKKESSKKAWLIYHGAEPADSVRGISKDIARARFSSLPQRNNNRIALAFGFMTVGKGWDILGKMRIPENWTIVINSSVNHSTGEMIQLDNIESTRNMGNTNGIINLNQNYLSEEDLSTLFYASDAVLLPYKVTSGSGVMFDALGHGIPFIASNLPFFKEFASKGLGITAKRTPNAFTEALLELENNYGKYKKTVEGFQKYLKWALIARNHVELYHNITNPGPDNNATVTISEILTDPTSTPS